MRDVRGLLPGAIEVACAAIDVDAALWVARHGPTAAHDRAGRIDRARVRALVESNEILALRFGTLRRLAADLPGEAPVDDPVCGTAASVVEWCDYALGGTAAMRARLLAELGAGGGT